MHRGNVNKKIKCILETRNTTEIAKVVHKVHKVYIRCVSSFLFVSVLICVFCSICIFYILRTIFLVFFSYSWILIKSGAKNYLRSPVLLFSRSSKKRSMFQAISSSNHFLAQSKIAPRQRNKR